jgi:hypothetical protein
MLRPRDDALSREARGRQGDDRKIACNRTGTEHQVSCLNDGYLLQVQSQQIFFGAD